ncbi:phosphoribosylglycinamide formyltransferase [Alkalitalea saponilacus]|uniref:Phosphoribosylglycinamide formyltransferase n=1 Tax=Alkalitalea saponilacus TaxID=889453 RepID=A0A1T5BQL2_9BACT|nr:phosphoribosylglycinamide formyltransferase [Alkalitalea saponilacus]ASB49622.1 phosphoribosylglycinamide formyltransferase [Alkalitalea saponilacus]SKB49652.1 phosphoribosylglycinamide formyltransferase-1 [Alkalitalea saponilacus]
MKNIIILASGSGTNAENIIKYFNNSTTAKVTWLLSNKEDAYAITRAKNLNINTLTFTKEEFSNLDKVLHFLIEKQPDLIVLAGFLLLVPSKIVRAFPNRIVNIHPALLPAYGGKGMYGEHVHKAVIENKENKSGITIHFVNENYDEGDIIFQASCSISKNDTPESLAEKIHELEHAHFPKVIEGLLG